MNSAIDHISRLLNIHFGIKPKLIVLLPGYDNQNYKIICKNGQMCVAKLHINPHLLPFLEAECRLLDFLSAQMPGKFPEVIRTVSNAYYFRDDSKVVRLFSWLEGSFLAEKTITEKTAASLGTFLAEMNKTLMGYRDPVIKSRELSWDLQRFTELQNKMDVIPDPALKKLIHHFLLQYNMEVLPRLPELRNSIIHNDANDNNILVRDEQITGLIDFGDAVYGPVIQEVAVAMTYLMMDLEEPLEIAIPFLKSYHSSFHLEDKEVDLLYFLVGARLSISLIHSFETILQGKADEYTLISQQPAIDLLKKWIGISPDKVSRFVRKALGMPVTEITDYKAEIKKRNKFIGKILSVSYQTPIRMQRAAFQYMFDADGNTYLDAYNNIPHVGHQHPRVVEAAQRQMAKLNTNTRYLYDQLAAYAERLLAKFPKPLKKVFFVNSGSEASDLAIRIAQTVTGHKQIAVLEHGYHGNTRMGIDISHYKFAGKGGDGAKDFVTVLPIPDTYRGKYRTDDGTAGKAYAADAIQILNDSNDPLAAFIAEPIVGCGGQVPLAKDYLKQIYPEIRKRGGLCISDEVQVGFGRLGSHFWGFEMHDVVPDIVVLGKPMGNGHPIGAVVTSDEIADAFNNGMEFFSSFGGNPVSCAIGMAVLDVIKEENLQQNALETGTYFMDELRKLQKEFPQIGDIRGSGLFIGIDLVTDPETREPNTQLAQTLKNKLRENFILISTDGPADNVVKVKPALCFDKKDVNIFIQKVKALM